MFAWYSSSGVYQEILSLGKYFPIHSLGSRRYIGKYYLWWSCHSIASLLPMKLVQIIQSFQFNAIFSRFSSYCHTGFVNFVLLHCSSIYLLIFLFSFFVCVYSKFWVNLCQPINSLPFALLQFFSHLISSSSFNPLPLPTSRLPSPSSLPLRLAEANLWSPTLPTPVDNGLWNEIIMYFVFSVFSMYWLMYVKCLEISFTTRIGLLDKLVQV